MRMSVTYGLPGFHQMSEYIRSLLLQRRRKIASELRRTALWQEWVQVREELSKLGQSEIKIHLDIEARLPVSYIKEPSFIRTHDANNTPDPSIPYGKRIEKIYGIIEDVVRQLGGTATVDEVVENLTVMYEMNLEGRLRERVASFIATYNKRCPENQTLELWPQRTAEQKKVAQYEKIIYRGRQHIGAV